MLLAVATMLSTSRARAESLPTVRVDFAHVVRDAAKWYEETFLRRAAPPVVSADAPPLGPNGWLGVSPRFSLVARDWDGALPVAGRNVLLVDQMRPSRSSRMVVSRVRLADGKFVPFAQLGAGQWRPDPTLMPRGRVPTDFAAQVGVGWELQVAKSASLAWEFDYTMLLPDDQSSLELTRGRVIGSFLALRTAF